MTVYRMYAVFLRHGEMLTRPFWEQDEAEKEMNSTWRGYGHTEVRPVIVEQEIENE